MFNIEEELKKLPAKPGVYIMHNDKDEIIYVGKAIKLCNRVRQYFQGSRNLTTKIQHMVSHILSTSLQIQSWRPWCLSAI